ncbi:MAG: hypothetical protein HY286_10140 [Planctomycetes bacterium]|nr:hypothetical protein [Planctomycetota bacterium]
MTKINQTGGSGFVDPNQGPKKANEAGKAKDVGPTGFVSPAPSTPQTPGGVAPAAALPPALLHAMNARVKEGMEKAWPKERTQRAVIDEILNSDFGAGLSKGIGENVKGAFEEHEILQKLADNFYNKALKNL